MLIKIFCATEEERDALKEILKGLPKTKFMLYHMGVGKVNASAAGAVHKIRPPAVWLNIGFCGTLYKDTPKVSQVNLTYQGDLDLTPLGCPIGSLEKVRTPCTLDTLESDIPSVGCLTTDSFITKKKAKHLKKAFDKRFQVVDMEIAALAHHSEGHYLYSLKIASDDCSASKYDSNKHTLLQYKQKILTYIKSIERRHS